ncbi:hypothetical protein FDECE_8166 [Fusarium decemcellulare]|nr:hypothetical protein FDECE_8166 [Fusarium decemcellulare]
MRGHLVLTIILSLGFTGTLAQSDDLVDFPATGELDVVFPQNDTYAVEAPFPIIFGFQNAPVLLSFPTILYWELDCRTLFGIGRLEGERLVAPPSDPYFYVNASDALMKPEEGDQWRYWLGEEETCVLTWEFKYYTTCERQPNGSLKIMGGYFGERTGNVTFTLKPGATSPRDAIAKYDGCAVAGTAVKVASNETGCAQIAEDAAPKPKPCGLDVKKVASSLAAAVVKPTTSLTEVPSKTTDTVGGTQTGSDGSSEATGGSSANEDDSGSDNSNDDDDNWAAPGLGVNGGGLTLAVVVAAALPFLL